MDKREILILIGSISAFMLIIIILIIRNTHSSNIKKKMDDLYVRYNNLKTVPITFKLNKAQAMSKNNEQMQESVRECFSKYEEAEKHLNDIQEELSNIEDCLKSNKYKENIRLIGECETRVAGLEDEIKQIDVFLEEFSKKEAEQREFSSDLKEKYRVVKKTINENATLLSIAYEGLLNKLGKCEDLFASSEEFIFANDYAAAQEDLDEINKLLENIKLNANSVPKCVKDTKGVLPVMLDETKRELALTRQRGVFVDHLDIDSKIEEIETTLNSDVKNLIEGNTEGIRDNCQVSKKTLNDLNDALAAENRSYKQAKDTLDKALSGIDDLAKVENYVRVAYDKDSARYALQDLKKTLKEKRNNIEVYRNMYKIVSEDLGSSSKPSSEILVAAESLVNDVDKDSKELYSFKIVIDKSTDGESRATSQLTKLQLVVSEVETKICEYHLPILASQYSDDLAKSREYIMELKKLCGEVPINIEELNKVLDEAINFIYNFYNNVNNVVGMAIMVENAIVFGNKYRSSIPEVDRELSKAEFQYLNGEYTKALKTAISCMETLFPDNADEKILENA